MVGCSFVDKSWVLNRKNIEENYCLKNNGSLLFLLTVTQDKSKINKAALAARREKGR